MNAIRAPRATGLTLIELLVTLVIAGILAALAVPAYTGYVQHARRADARSALLDTANRLEKYYSDHLAYPDTLAAAGCLEDSAGGYYRLSLLISGGGSGYAITATARNDRPQFRDRRCRTFTLDSVGERGARDADDRNGRENCW